jgi:hypothetical protein
MRLVTTTADRLESVMADSLSDAMRKERTCFDAE